MKKKKSLGVIEWPVLEITNFDGGTGIIELQISNFHKRVFTRCSSVFLAKHLADTAREITKRHRDHVRQERRYYLELKKYTGYVPKDGDGDE